MPSRWAVDAEPMGGSVTKLQAVAGSGWEAAAVVVAAWLGVRGGAGGVLQFLDKVVIVPLLGLLPLLFVGGRAALGQGC